MEKEGYRRSTILSAVSSLNSIAHRTNLMEPESVKRYLSTAQITISMQDYKIIDSIIAQNFDVLDEKTVTTWDSRKIVGSDGLMANVQLDAFLDDVNKHYEKLKHVVATDI